MSTRQLTDSAESISDTYTYDAFGRLISSSGGTANTYLYTGAQFDPNIGFYYLRARYSDPSTGRFLTQDPFPGSIFEPVSLHHYLYANADPVNNLDPSGEFTLVGLMVSISINTSLRSTYVTNVLQSFITSVQTAFCVIEPATQMRSIALMAIGSGAGKWAYDLEYSSRRLMAEGYAQIGEAIAGAYVSIAQAMLPEVKVELNIDLDLLIRGYSLRGLIEKAQEIRGFKDKMQTYIDIASNLYALRDDPCEFWTAMEDYGDDILGLIPSF
jgi:RHS repeat-associated protein